MSILKKGIFVVAAKRTPFGAYGGKLKDFSCTTLAEIAARSALESGKVSPSLVDHVIFGNVVQSNKDTPYLSRHVGLRVGVPQDVPALTVNRLCGSGFQAVVSGTQEILSDEARVVLVGGSENMSEAPFVVRDVRFGTRFGMDYKFEDVLWAALTDYHTKLPMGITAENLAERYGISREECDQFALLSQQRWKAANESGQFKSEMAPVVVKSKKGEAVVDTDEHPREASLDKLAKLPTVFKKNGTVTAGNASGVCDGAGALVLASEEAVTANGLTPLARLCGWSVVGCDPKEMGIGPAPAIRKLLAKTGRSLEQIDIVDVNEAFAPQFLAVQKELGLDPARSNPHGGAIALGHPVGASGARISAHLAHQLKDRSDVKSAIGSACIGGGQGIALLFEKA